MNQQASRELSLSHQAIRVAHIVLGRCNPDSPNGVDKTAYFLSRSLAGLGANILLASITHKEAVPLANAESRSYPPRFARWLQDLPVVGDVLLRSPLGLPSKLKRDLALWAPDFVHFHFVHNAVFPRLARSLRRDSIPYVVTPNGGLTVVAQRRRAYLKRAFGRFVERSYLRKARFIHVVSSLDAEGVQRFGVENVFVEAPNGIDASTIPSDLDASLLKRRFPELKEKKVGLFLGRLDPDQKGLDICLEALAGFDSRLSLILVGPDWRGQRKLLEGRVEKLHLSDRITFAGLALGSERFDLMAGADFFVHPSRWEAGIPFSVLEAMSVGLPCLVSRGADPSESIRKAGAGTTVRPNPQSIREGLAMFLEMSSLELAQMGRRARQLVKNHYSWDVIAPRLLRAYERYGRAT